MSSSYDGVVENHWMSDAWKWHVWSGENPDDHIKLHNIRVQHRNAEVDKPVIYDKWIAQSFERGKNKKDAADQDEIISKLVRISLFSPDTSLRNVVTDAVAQEGVNVHEYESVGDNIMHNFIGLSAFTVSFSRKDKAGTHGQTSAIKFAPDWTIDLILLFERFLVISGVGDKLSLEEVMSHELSTFPPALFEVRSVFRTANKSQQAHTICDHVSDTILYSVSQTESYYGSDTTVVFEDGSSVKDNTHKREEHNIHPVVIFIAEAKFSGKKEEFLFNRDWSGWQLINLDKVVTPWTMRMGMLAQT